MVHYGHGSEDQCPVLAEKDEKYCCSCSSDDTEEEVHEHYSGEDIVMEDEVADGGQVEAINEEEAMDKEGGLEEELGVDEEQGVDAESGSPGPPTPSNVDSEEIRGLGEDLRRSPPFPPVDYDGFEPLFPIIGDKVVTTSGIDLEEVYGRTEGCRFLGNGCSFHVHSGLPIENDEWMKDMLESWASKATDNSRSRAQADGVLYGEVAWLNRRGLDREPQISYATVSPRFLPSCAAWSISTRAAIPCQASIIHIPREYSDL